jgi:hypothetical protein
MCRDSLVREPIRAADPAIFADKNQQKMAQKGRYIWRYFETCGRNFYRALLGFIRIRISEARRFHGDALPETFEAIGHDLQCVATIHSFNPRCRTC